MSLILVPGDRDIYPTSFLLLSKDGGLPWEITPLTCRLQCVVWGGDTREAPWQKAKKEAVLNAREANYCQRGDKGGI